MSQDLREKLEKIRDKNGPSYMYLFEDGFDKCLDLLWPLVETVEWIAKTIDHDSDLHARRLLENRIEHCKKDIEDLEEKLK